MICLFCREPFHPHAVPGEKDFDQVANDLAGMIRCCLGDILVINHLIFFLAETDLLGFQSLVLTSWFFSLPSVF